MRKLIYVRNLIGFVDLLPGGFGYNVGTLLLLLWLLVDLLILVLVWPLRRLRRRMAAIVRLLDEYLEDPRAQLERLKRER